MTSEPGLHRFPGVTQEREGGLLGAFGDAEGWTRSPHPSGDTRGTGPFGVCLSQQTQAGLKTATADPKDTASTLALSEPEPSRCWEDSLGAKRTRPGPLAGAAGAGLPPTTPFPRHSRSHHLLHGGSAATTADQRKEEMVQDKIRKGKGSWALRVQDLSFAGSFNSFPPPRLPCELINNKSLHSLNSQDKHALGHTAYKGGLVWVFLTWSFVCLLVF